MQAPWGELFTRFYHAPVVRRVWILVACLCAYTEVIVLVGRQFLQAEGQLQSTLHTVMGLVLGMLLVFRTNTAYDRWWEARKLWGQLVNDIRNLSIKVRLFVNVEQKEIAQFGWLLVTFSHALRDHLRDAAAVENYAVFEGAHGPKHVPSYVARLIFEKVRLWKHQGHIDGFEALMLDEHAKVLMDVCGGCERLRRTPITRSYLVFLRQCIGAYLLTLPFGLIRDFGHWSVLAAGAVAYFMIGIESIAEDIEEPFGFDANDLRLDDICQTIEASVTEALIAARVKTAAHDFKTHYDQGRY